MEQKSTGALNRILQKTEPSRISDYLTENRDELKQEEHPFTVYVKEILKEKQLSQQDLFLRAGISEHYGYKLISGEKHTRKRDVIIRMAVGGKFDVSETNHALQLYGMSILYPRIPRDAVLIVALNNHISDVDRVNALLEENQMPALENCGEESSMK